MDSHEVLMDLLMGIHEATTTRRQAPRKCHGLQDGCNCPVCKCFLAKISSTTSCRECGASRSRVETLGYIGLSLIQTPRQAIPGFPKSESFVRSIVESLQQYTTAE